MPPPVLPTTDVLDDIADYLIGQGLATEQDLFTGEEPPDGVDPAVTLTLRPGETGATTHDQIAPVIEYLHVFVNCRSQDQQAARLRAQQVYAALFVGAIARHDRYYYTLRPMQPPFEAGPPDANNRRQYAFILRLQRRN